MKHATVVGICLLVVFGITHDVAQASMYWDLETPELETLGEPEGAPRDVRPVQDPVRQQAPMMYDDYELPDIEPLSVTEPPSTTPIRTTEDSVSAPVARPQTQRDTRQVGPSVTSSQPVSPRPAVTQPGAQSVNQEKAAQPPQVAPPGTSPPATAADQGKTQQPETKKMKWGKSE